MSAHEQSARATARRRLSVHLDIMPAPSAIAHHWPAVGQLEAILSPRHPSPRGKDHELLRPSAPAAPPPAFEQAAASYTPKHATSTTKPYRESRPTETTGVDHQGAQGRLLLVGKGAVLGSARRPARCGVGRIAAAAAEQDDTSSALPRWGTSGSAGFRLGCRISRGRWTDPQRDRGPDADRRGRTPNQGRAAPRPLEQSTTNDGARGLMRQPQAKAPSLCRCGLPGPAFHSIAVEMIRAPAQSLNRGACLLPRIPGVGLAAPSRG